MVENIQDKSGKGSDGVKADDHVNLVAFQPEHSSAIFGSGHGGKDRQREDTKALEAKGAIPTVQLEDSIEVDYSESTNTGHSFRGWIADKFASDDEREIIHDFNKLAKETGHELLTDTQKLQIENLPEDQKEMYRFALDSLIDLKDGKISPADYMMNNLDNAVKLAEKNGREPGSWNFLKTSREQLFVNYVGLVMSEEPMGFINDTGRELAGGGPHIAGSALETVYQAIVADKRGAEGFNTNITDKNTSDTITHHFREFLLASYNTNKTFADIEAVMIDDPKKNPGDVRNAYYANMLGSALRMGVITPREAADMTRWAYTKHGGKQPPFGAANVDGSYLRPGKDFRIRDWLKAYRERDK